MAAFYPMDTPDRVLQRVQQMENMELPSLPSIQHDDEDEFESDTMTGESSVNESIDIAPVPAKGISTPHPLRKSYLPPPSSSAGSSSRSTSLPYPPLLDEHGTPSPYLPPSARTSTPQTAQTHLSRSQQHASFRQSHRRIKSGTTDLESSTATKRDLWQTPGELSQSFSGEVIPNEIEEHASVSEISETESVERSPAQSSQQTPLNRRLSSGNVVLTRPNRRPSSQAFQPLQSVKEIRIPSPIAGSTPGGSVTDTTQPGSPDNVQSVQERVPSLSRSDFSASERSEAASTPEGPSRNPAIITPRGIAGTVIPVSARRIDWDMTEDQSTDRSEATEISQTDNMEPPSLGSMLLANLPSPMKRGQISTQSTPGITCLNHQTSLSSNFMPTPRPRAPFSDVSSVQNTPHMVPFTPSPQNIKELNDDPSTPRAPLDDAERRKNHVLTVLRAGALPSRTPHRPRGTSHPLRRASHAPSVQPIAELSASWKSPQSQLATPVPHPVADSSANESFVSVASSADLTSDRRATSHRQGLSRGNISFPTILLPTAHASASPGALHHGDQRADSVKIHKHLNAMNKQLLEANADLAREAEAWRAEVERLNQALRDSGIEVEENDIGDRYPHRSLGDSPSEISAHENIPSRSDLRDPSGESSYISPAEQQAILEEMAVKLEDLENRMMEKDQIIADLEDQLQHSSTSHHSSELEVPNEEIVKSNRVIEERDAARFAMQQEFALRTEEHARQFGDICADFERQVDSLQLEVRQAHKTIEELRQTQIQEASPDRDILSTSSDSHHSTSDNADKAKSEFRITTETLRETQLENERLTRELNNHVERFDQLKEEYEFREHSERDLVDAQAERDSLQNRLIESEEKCGQLHDSLSALQETINERDGQLAKYAEEIDQLSTQVERKQAELQTAEIASSQEINRLKTELASNSETLAQMEAELRILRANDMKDFNREEHSILETHLEEAFREIGRLKHALAASPHLESTLEVRNAQIEALEREKTALQDRLAALRDSVPSTSMAVSPFKATPFVHKAIASLRMPKTPGSLQDLSWLHSTVGDANEPILRAQIDQLQHQLDSANGQLDSNFSRLEAAGLKGLRLAEDLAAAQNRITDLEDELRAMAQRNRESLDLMTEQRTREEREGDVRMSEAMQTVQEQVERLQADLGAEKSRLQKENKRLTAVVAELRRDHAMDLQAVKAEFDTELSERQSEARRLKHELAVAKRDLTESERKRDDFISKLHAAENTVRELEVGLQSAGDRFKAHAEAESQRQLVSQLRSALSAAEEDAVASRRLLSSRDADLKAAESRLATLQQDRATIVVQLKEFEADLNFHQGDSRKFREELQRLKVDQNARETRHTEDMRAAELRAREVQSRSSALERKLEEVERERTELLSRFKSLPDNDNKLEEQRIKFRTQMQDLATQVRYLKAKFTREASFRNALSVQKRYLLLLVGGMSLNEQAVFRQIASMGIPIDPPRRPKRTLKAVGIAILSTIRAKNVAKHWRAEKEIKTRAVAARADRKRIASEA